MYQVKLYFSAKLALHFSLAIPRQETFVRSFGVFWVRREWSGEAEGGKEKERASEGERKSEGERGKADDGREEGVGDQSRRGSFVDKRPGCSPSASPSLCVPASTDRPRPRSENAAFAATQRRTTEKEKRRERNVGRTDGRSDRRSGGRRAARRSGGKSARMHFLPLHSPFS